MRLNQLAKKVGKPYTRVEKYIRKELNVEGIEGPNARVEDDIVEKVIHKFGIAKEGAVADVKPKLTTVEAKPADINPEETGLEEVNLKKIESTPAEILKPNLEGLETAKKEVSNNADQEKGAQGNTIESDASVGEGENKEVAEATESDIETTKKEEVVNTIETEDTVLHLDEEGTIVAPKVKLEGFKVKGKIDLPFNSKSDKESSADAVVDSDQEEVEAKEEVVLTEEEIQNKEAEAKKALEEEQKKIKARQKNIDTEAAKAAAYKAEKEKREEEKLRRQIEEEKRKKREEGRQHYINQVQPKQSKPKKKKVKAKAEKESDDSFEIKEKYQNTENLTTWQKIVRWFNT